MIDLTTESHARDPYPTYAAMRAAGRAHWDERTQSWFITGFEDVNRLLTADVLRSRGIPPFVSELPLSEREVIEPVEQFYSRWLVFSDRPEHMALRTRLSSTLAGSAMRSLRASVVQWTQDAVDRFVADPDDLVQGLARPLAIRCLEEVLGVSGSSTAEALELSDRLIAYLVTTGSDLEAAPAASEAIADLMDVVFGTLLPSRRGLVTVPLADIASEGTIDRLTIAAAVAQFLTGTIEPTTTAVAVALAETSQSPRVSTGLAMGSITSEAITEEALRFDSPFHFAPRTAVRDFALGDANVKAGQRTVLVLASANRDERRWTDPESFDPSRATRPHLAFGRGSHACLGAALARLQTSVAVDVAGTAGLLGTPAGPLERLPRIGATSLSVRVM